MKCKQCGETISPFHQCLCGIKRREARLEMSQSRISELEHQLSATQAELERCRYSDNMMAQKFDKAQAELEEAKAKQYPHTVFLEVIERAEAAEKELEETKAKVDGLAVLLQEASNKLAMYSQDNHHKEVNKLIKERDELREAVTNLEKVIEAQKNTYTGSKAYWEAENQALRNECERLKDKFKRCDEERAMANRQTEKHKDMWKGQCNRTALLESELAALRRALERIATLTDEEYHDIYDARIIAREALGMGENCDKETGNT